MIAVNALRIFSALLLLIAVPACAAPPAPTSPCGPHPAPCVVIGADQLLEVAQAIALARDTKINAAKADDALLQSLQEQVDPQIKKPDDKPKDAPKSK